MSFSDVRDKNLPRQNQANKNKATTTRQGVWGVSGVGFSTVFGGSVLGNLQFPRSPKSKPKSCPSHSPALLCFLEVRGNFCPNSCWQKAQQLSGTGLFPLHLPLCCQNDRASCSPTLPLPQNEKGKKKKKVLRLKSSISGLQWGKKKSRSFQGRCLNLVLFMPICGEAEKRHFSQAWLDDVQQVFGKHCGSARGGKPVTHVEAPCWQHRPCTGIRLRKDLPARL